MPEVLHWPGSADRRAVVDRAVQALASGQLVAVPTETVYGIAASVFHPEAVERLARGKGRPEGKPMALAVSGLDEALRWVPRLGPAGCRLARRCWPGPVTVVSGEGVEAGRAAHLPAAVRQRLCPHGTIGLRVPAHDAVLDVLRSLAGPLVLTSANPGGGPEAVTADEAVRGVGDLVDLVLANGTCRYGTASTVVRVEGDRWELLREGAVPRQAVERLTGKLIVFICTGNTCRSPLAEALFKKLLAERLGCRPEDLASRGYHVRSAGVGAFEGLGAAPEAAAIAREFGASLDDHVSRGLTPELAAHADFLITMTHAHALVLEESGLGCRPRLLCPAGADVPDPIGADEHVYRACAEQIQRHLEALLPEVLGS